MINYVNLHCNKLIRTLGRETERFAPQLSMQLLNYPKKLKDLIY